MTPKQAQTVNFLCSMANARGYNCEVVAKPRDPDEGAAIRISRNNKDWERIGVTPEGSAISVAVSQERYGRDTDRFSCFVRDIVAKSRKKLK